MSKEALKEIYQVLLTEPHTPTVCTKLERIAREALAQQHLQDLHDENVHLGLYADEFCDANCTWSDHHPDCKYGTQNSDELTVAYMSGLYDGKKQAKPQRSEASTWVGLTDEQIRQVMRSLGWTGEGPSDIEFARAIEAKLKEKNT